MSSENQIGHTAELVASYCKPLSLGISEMAKETGFLEEYVEKLFSGDRQFSREAVERVAEVIKRKMDETGQGDKFGFSEEKELLESAGYAAIAPPSTCIGGMPIRPDPLDY